jgi:flagellar hook-associated protein 1 FlgK
MSIDGILRNAVSSLNAQQAALRVISDNVANVNTPGYARRVAQLQSNVLAGVGSGVEVGEVQRIADRFLDSELFNASGFSGFYGVQTELHDRLQSALGEPSSDANLIGRISQAFSSIGALALAPGEAPSRISAVEDMQTLGDEIDRLARELQSLRGDADHRVADDVTTLDQALEQVYELNRLVVRQKAVGADTGALEEQRAQALEKVAGIVDVRPVEQADGSVYVFTRSGMTLLDASRREIRYQASGQPDTSTAFGAVTVHRVDNATGAVAAAGDELYPALRSGSLKGAIDMRDKELPELGRSLGEFAAKLVDAVNAAHNDHTAVPPPASLTGRNVGALGTDPHGFTGMATFAVLDADGAIVDQTTIDFSNAALVTLNDVVAAVNAGLAGNGSLTLSGGALKLSASAAGDGVAIVQDAGSPSSKAGRSFAQVFGMNDLMEARAPAHFDAGLGGASAHGFGGAGTVALAMRGPGGQVAGSYVLDFSTLGGTVADAVNALNANLGAYATFSLDANGALTATPTSAYAGFELHVTSDSTARGATGVSFSDFFGLGERHQLDHALNVAVVDGVRRDHTRLALATVDLGAAAGEPAIGVGDGSGALALQSVQSVSLGFSAAGDLSAVRTTLAGYAGQILAHSGQEAARSASLGADRDALKMEITARRSAATGVNLDEELSNMILFQNAYNAAARMITTANQMYDELLRTV